MCALSIMPTIEREYFYRIDSQGYLYHDRTLLTDLKFLDFFFKRLQPNATGLHTDYPYVSPCGREMNYIACAGTPIVFHAIEDNCLYYNHTGLNVAFDPDSLCINSRGDLFHPVGKIHGRLGAGPLYTLAGHIVETDDVYTLRWHAVQYAIPECAESLA